MTHGIGGPVTSCQADCKRLIESSLVGYLRRRPRGNACVSSVRHRSSTVTCHGHASPSSRSYPSKELLLKPRLSRPLLAARRQRRAARRRRGRRPCPPSAARAACRRSDPSAGPTRPDADPESPTPTDGRRPTRTGAPPSRPRTRRPRRPATTEPPPRRPRRPAYRPTPTTRHPTDHAGHRPRRPRRRRVDQPRRPAPSGSTPCLAVGRPEGHADPGSTAATTATKDPADVDPQGVVG